MTSPKILVSGSGIAGSVFAFWLLRAYPDAHVTLVERAPALRLTGASVDIRGSAIDIVKHMGLEEAIRAQTTREIGVQCVNADGGVSWQLGATGREDMQSVTSEYEIFRGALAKIFLQPIEGRVQLVLDEYVKSFVQHDGGVDVIFANGKLPETYDLLVAADGVQSRIRGQMLDAPSQDQILDKGCHVAYFTLKSDLLAGEQWAKWHNSARGRVIFLRPDPDPRGRTRAYLVNITTSAQVERRSAAKRGVGAG